MLIGIFGNIGAGKTLLSTIFSIISIKDKIYANYKINNEKYCPLKLIDLLELPNNVDVVIDEAYTWLESRTSMSKINLYISYIIFQSRKRNVDIFITAQLESTVDLRFRELCHVHFIAHNVVNHLNETIAFFYELFYNSKYLGNFYFLESDVREYYKSYDTNEIIEPRNFRKLKIELLSDSIDRLIPFLDSLLPEIRKLVKKSKHNNRYTKTEIKAHLTTLNIPTRFCEYYYHKLNEN